MVYMKFIELQKFNEYSVILRTDDKGKPIAIEPFVAVCKPNIKDGEVVDWWFGHYFSNLFDAVNYARTRGLGAINYYRLEEIASKAIDGLIEDDEESAYEYFAKEIEIDYHEAKYFGLDENLLDRYK